MMAERARDQSHDGNFTHTKPGGIRGALGPSHLSRPSPALASSPDNAAPPACYVRPVHASPPSPAFMHAVSAWPTPTCTPCPSSPPPLPSSPVLASSPTKHFERPVHARLLHVLACVLGLSHACLCRNMKVYIVYPSADPEEILGRPDCHTFQTLNKTWHNLNAHLLEPCRQPWRLTPSAI